MINLFYNVLFTGLLKNLPWQLFTPTRKCRQHQESTLSMLRQTQSSVKSTGELESSKEEEESHLTVKNNCYSSVQVFNSPMEKLAEVSVQKKKIDQLQHQLKSWDACSDVEREEFVCKATEACRLVCNVIAPNDGEKLLQALQGEKVNDTTADPGLGALVAA